MSERDQNFKLWATREADLRPKAVAQIRDALTTLCFVADGMYEDEAQVALDALDWIEDHR